MSASTTSLPDLPSLTRGLEIALGTPGRPARAVRVVDRRSNIYASSLPSEFVTCRLPDGQVLELFCKYTSERFEDCHGHRQNVSHEANVYQDLVNPLGAAAPHYYGTAPGVNREGTWLFLEALLEARQLTEIADQGRALRTAASEIGRFQNLCENTGKLTAVSSMRRYTREYFLGWISRTVEYAAELTERMPWLPDLCRQSEALMEPLLDAPQTVIHGECYPHNVLCRGDEVYLIDWQSTAIGPGEIDLATLTEKWPVDVVDECKSAYVRERWPLGAHAEFESTLEAARLYLVFRWLGDRPEWTVSPRAEWSFEQLRRLASRMNLISG